ncbi:hypothetical protein Plhal304r1_c004g0017381 [Plasmopara halstedii]
MDGTCVFSVYSMKKRTTYLDCGVFAICCCEYPNFSCCIDGCIRYNFYLL